MKKRADVQKVEGELGVRKTEIASGRRMKKYDR